MENNLIVKPHEIILSNREKGTVSGVQKVLFVKENAISLSTTKGTLSLSGKNFSVTRYDEKEGLFCFAGEVDGAAYSGKKEPLLKKIFK